MATREILKMGHPTLLEVAKPVEKFNTSELDSIIEDMIDTMKENDGAGLAAPQIGLGMQLVIFGFDSNERYPEADQVPFTVLINPVITPIGDEEEDGWEGCLSVPGLMGVVPRFKKIRYQGKDQHGNPTGLTFMIGIPTHGWMTEGSTHAGAHGAHPPAGDRERARARARVRTTCSSSGRCPWP